MEKINLLYETSIDNPFNSEWFCWIDAGISSLRNRTDNIPVKITNNIIYLLEKDKINYSSSEINDIDYDWNEYKHDVAGTMFIIHKDKIKFYKNLFYQYLNECVKNTNKYTCYSDQIIFSKIKLKYPEYFHKLCSGYGCMVNL